MAWYKYISFPTTNYGSYTFPSDAKLVIPQCGRRSSSYSYVGAGAFWYNNSVATFSSLTSNTTYSIVDYYAGYSGGSYAYNKENSGVSRPGSISMNLNKLYFYSDTEPQSLYSFVKKLNNVVLNGDYVIKYNIDDILNNDYTLLSKCLFAVNGKEGKITINGNKVYNFTVHTSETPSDMSTVSFYDNLRNGVFEFNKKPYCLIFYSNNSLQFPYTFTSFYSLRQLGNTTIHFNNVEVHEDFAKFLLEIADSQDQITLTFGDSIVLANKPVTEISVVKKTLNLVDITIDGVTSEVEIHPQEDKVFLGFSLRENSTVATIPIGTTKITLNENTVFYEVWGTYKPEPNFFTANFYKNSAENHRVDKTEYLTSVFSAGISLREETNIIYPTILLQYDKVPDFNYCYIEYFGRYYYVTDITSIRNNIWQINLSVDVLMSFKDIIKTQMGNVIRQENIGNSMMVDSNIPVLGQPSIIYENFGTPVFDGLSNYYITENNEISFVLITQGKLLNG